MSSHLPQEKIAEIQQATDIVNIVSEYVVLKNVGKNHIGLCPFHNEKTPSFTVNHERQYYKCFGCGEAGTVFTFLMKHNGIKFPDAVRTLADRANIALPKNVNDRETSDENRVLFTINKHFAKFYHDILVARDASKNVRAYIAKRGINEESVKKFAIGFSLQSWDASLKEATARKFKTDELEKAGIVLPRKKGAGFYDRFRGRLMFPILNETENVIGFGARTLDDSQIKYINSPESKIFNKRRTLYGLNFAKSKIVERNEAILMEGYTDVIMAHQYGIDWSVGVMGTSLTHEHVKLIKRYCKQVVLVLDADTAGIKSAEKSANLFIENGLDVKIVQLPQGCDPCEFLAANGKESFMDCIKGGDDFFEFKLKIARLRGELETVSGKTKVFNELFSTAIKIPDILKQGIQIKEIVKKIDIDETRIQKYLRNLKKAKTSDVNVKPVAALDQNNKMYVSGSQKPLASDRIETNLIRLMITDNKYIPLVKSDIGLENFLNETLQCIVRTIFEIYESSGRGSVAEVDLFSMLTDSELHQILADIMSEEIEYDNGENIFKGCKRYFDKRLSKLEIRKTMQLTKDIAADLRKENEAKEKEHLNALLDKFHNENKRLQSFKGNNTNAHGLKKKSKIFA